MPRPQTYLAIDASCRNRSQRLKHPGKLGPLSPPVPWGCRQLAGVLLTYAISMHLVWAPQGGRGRQTPHTPLPGHVRAAQAVLHGPGSGEVHGQGCLGGQRFFGHGDVRGPQALHQPCRSTALRHRAGQGAKMLSATLVTGPAPLGSNTSSGLPKSCEGSGSCEHRARVWGVRALGGAVTQAPGEHGVLVPPACHHGDAARLSGVALP